MFIYLKINNKTLYSIRSIKTGLRPFIYTCISDQKGTQTHARPQSLKNGSSGVHNQSGISGMIFEKYYS